MGVRGQIRWGREIDAVILRELVAKGCHDRNSLHQGVIAWCAGIDRPCSLKIETIDRWAQCAVESGHIGAIQQGSITEMRPRSGGMRTIPAYQFYLPEDAERVSQTLDRRRLALAKWGNQVDADTIWRAVAAGAFDRFTLADWLNNEFVGYQPIAPIKAEEWAHHASKCGAIERHRLQCGTPPYVHAPGAYRSMFHRFTLGERPEQSRQDPVGIEECRSIMQVFGLIPPTMPGFGIGRIHRMEDR